MKKIMFSLMAVCLPLFFCAQTEEIEKTYLNNLIATGKMTSSEANSMGNAWRELLKEFGGYPQLPYNPDSKKIEFVDVIEFSSKSKAQLIDYVKEWLAINYGNINDVLHYEDQQNGKLIAKGFFTLPYESHEWKWFGQKNRSVKESKCYHTIIFTVRDGKIKMEHRDLQYRFVIQGYTIGNTYFPSEDIQISLAGLYPVVAGDQNTWNSKLRTIQNANEEIKVSQNSLRRYIQVADYYNNF